MLRDSKILITGVTGQVAEPVALALAAGNEVWGAARFKDAAARARLEEGGVRCAEADLVGLSFDNLPETVDYVLHFGVVRSGKFDKDLTGNGEATGMLMARYATAKGFLHCSSTAVYQPDGHRHFTESDPLGDNHRAMFPTYSIAKISAEVVARTFARHLGLPTVIARLNVPYGDKGGWPAFQLEQMLAGQPVQVHTDAPTIYNPIHEDDIIESVPKLLEVASVPATIVNWAGPETVSVEEWCGYLGELVGREPTFEPTDLAIPSVAVDTTRMHELIGPARVTWKDGLRRMVETLHPELLS